MPGIEYSIYVTERRFYVNDLSGGIAGIYAHPPAVKFYSVIYWVAFFVTGVNEQQSKTK